MARLIFVFLCCFLTPALAQQPPQRSECLAMANAAPRVVPVAWQRAANAAEVEITYGGHSTYFIDTPGGLRIATDYSGAYQVGRLPDVVTMNRAHSTHYTLFPDKRIPTCCMAGARTASRRRSRSASATLSSATSPPTSAAISVTMPAPT
jgi:hypothetical protein